MHGIQEIADHFGVSHEAVRKHMKRGSIKAIKFGNLWKITSDEFNRIKREGVVIDKKPNKS